MFLNTLKLSVRNLLRWKGITLINGLGLSIGIAGSLVMLAFVLNEASYENFHQHKDRIVRVATDFGTLPNVMHLAGTMSALGPAAEQELPQVLESVRLVREQKTTLSLQDRSFQESQFFFSDPAVFNLFTFPLITGNPDQVLSTPFSVVISESMARKYFGKENPVGQSLILNDEHSLRITGIMQDVPRNTHLRPDFISSYSTFEKITTLEPSWQQFGTTHTYLFLSDNDLIKLEHQLYDLLVHNTNENFANMISYKIQPLSDIYLHSNRFGELSASGNVLYIYLFSSLAVLILIISCLNFVNLTLARFIQRSREIGIRKTLGAMRSHIIRQLFTESMLVTFVALLFGILIFELFFSRLDNLLGVSLVIDPFRSIGFYFIVLGILLFSGLAAGLYPALSLSQLKPADSIKGDAPPSFTLSRLKKALVVSQFVISIFLVTGTLVIHHQLTFMKQSDLGFNKENVLLVSFPAGEPGLREKYEALKTELSSLSQVKSITGAYTVPGLRNYELQSIMRPDQTSSEQHLMMRAIGVGYDYVVTLGLELVSGRDFSKDFGTDAEQSILVNQKAVRELNLPDPVGSELLIPGGKEKQRSVRIIGVVKDFHVQSLQKEIEPIFFYINPERFYTLAMRLSPNRTDHSLADIKQVWTRLLPNEPFEYSYLQDTYEALSLSEEKINQVITLFAGLAIFISCLGLYGLSTFTVAKRIKEMGIRKVLGASLSHLLVILSKDFVIWIALANLIAWPLAFYALQTWLNHFAYRIELTIWPFLLSGLAALVIALLTVCWQAIRAATANPVDSLRYE
ncbi:FtsX-like permease family protein [candidate division KSB1 bacterium]|nr:FtsX-like permease family protein [candidate division KSB1 bacterium]